MSSFVLKIESIETIAECIAYSLNTSERMPAIHFSFAPLSEALKDCRDRYGFYTMPRIAHKLYCLNLAATNSRYLQQFYSVPVFKKTGKNLLITGETIALIKLIECYLYQCAEDATYNSDLYKAIDEYLNSLYRYVVHKQPEYDAANWG